MNWKKWIGAWLIGLSGIWFAGLFVVPFIQFPLEIRAALTFLFLVLMEGYCWLGTVIVGKQAVSRFWNTLKSRRGNRSRGQNEQGDAKKETG